MDFVSSLLGIGSPKQKSAPIRLSQSSRSSSHTELDLDDEVRSHRGPTSTSHSRADSIAESTFSNRSRKIASIAKKAVQAEAEAKEAAARQAAKKAEEDAWEALGTSMEAKKIAEEEARRQKEEDEDLVELQRLETERRIAKLQRDQADEKARSDMKLPDGADGGLKRTRSDDQLSLILVLKRSEQHAKATISRYITDLNKHTRDRRYLSSYHAKIDDALIKLQEVKDALIKQPGVSTMEGIELEDMFFDYGQKVGRSKDQATMCMTKIDKFEQEKLGARRKQPLPDAKPDIPVEDAKPKPILKNVDKKDSSPKETGKRKGKGSPDTPQDYPPRPKFNLEADRRQSRELDEQIKAKAKAEAEKYREDLKKQSQDARQPNDARDWPDMGTALKRSWENYQTTSTPIPEPPPASAPNLPQYTAPPQERSYVPVPNPTFPPLPQHNQPNLSNQHVPNQRDAHQDQSQIPPFTYPQNVGPPHGFNRQDARPQQTPQPEYRQYRSEPVADILREENRPRPNVTSSGHRYLPPGVHNWTGEQGRTYNERPERPIIKIELSPFDGTPSTENWQRWKHNFGAVVGSKNYDDGTKMFQLLKALKGEPLRIAEALTMDSYGTEAYLEVWNTLEENYGGIYKLRNSIYSRIERFPKIKKFDKNNTLELENLLKAISAQFSNSQGIIDEGGVLNTQVKRLIPEYELARYFLQVAKEGASDTLQEFKKFISEQRVAYKLADTHQKEESSRALFTNETPTPNSEEIEQDQYESHAAYAPNS